MPNEISPPTREIVRRSDSNSRSAAGPLSRTLGWASAAVVAIAAVVVTFQTDTAQSRFNDMLADLTAPAEAVAPLPAPKSAETLALEAEVRKLTYDRQQLAARMAVLERNLSDMTGSISAAKAAALPAITQQAPIVQAPPVQAAPKVEAPRAEMAKPEGPKVEPKAEVQKPEPPKPEAKAVPAAAPVPSVNPLSMAAVTPKGGWAPSGNDDGATDIEPPVSQPLDQKAVGPLPPARMVTVPPGPKQQVASAAPATPHRPPRQSPRSTNRNRHRSRRGATMEVLRARWVVMKANHGPLLAGLQPIAIREPRIDGSTDCA